MPDFNEMMKKMDPKMMNALFSKAVEGLKNNPEGLRKINSDPEQMNKLLSIFPKTEHERIKSIISTPDKLEKSIKSGEVEDMLKKMNNT